MAYTAEKEKTKSPAARIKAVLKKLETKKAEKNVWNQHWQQIGEYFLTRKAIFTTQHAQGDFLNNELFDGTGPSALFKMASALVGMLWPSGAKSFVIKPSREIKESEQVKDYYERCSTILADEMDAPRAGLQIAIDEYMIDQGAFGTSGISVMPGTKTKLRYKAENVKYMCISEGPDGFIDTVYIEMQWPIEKAVREYGLKNLSKETQECYAKNKENDMIDLLFVVQPRMDVDKKKEGLHSMDYESMHIEVKQKHLIRESGFYEMPTIVARFRKALGETFGRSPAMEALPDVQEINALVESITIGIEKTVDPTLAIFNDGVLGSNEIDTSAGSLIVLNPTGFPTGVSPKDGVFPVFTVGDLKQGFALVERLEKVISEHFMLDRLLDFNNDNVMTLGEVNVRNRIRGFLLGSIFARQVAEMFDPLITRSFNILFDAGHLGVIRNSEKHREMMARGEDDILVIPDEIAKFMLDDRRNVIKKPPFKVEYVSPASRILQSEQAQAIVQTLDFVISSSQIYPESVDVMEMDKCIKTISRIYGIPLECMDSEEGTELKRQGREEAMAQQQKMAAAEQGATAVEKLAKANSYSLAKPGAKNNGSK